MKQTKRNIVNAQRDIRKFAGNRDTMTNIKVKKADVATALKENVLPAGTPINDKGKVDEVAPFGLLFNDLDFKNIQSGETVVASVMIDGFVDKERVAEYIGKAVPDGVITALKGKIQFL